MKAFVTGGTGFIGSHLVDHLLDNEAFTEVRCLIRSDEKWLSGKNFVKVKGDLHDLPVLNKAVQDVDVVLHLAGLVKAPSYQELERVNVDGTENLIRLAQKEGVKKIVVLSSLAAAGPSQDRPVTEEDPMMPVSLYGKSKKKMEEMIHRTANENLSVTILRPSAVYGPREDQIYTFFKMVSKHICPIVGDGTTPKISMVYVGDVVQGIMDAVNQKEPGVHTYFISGQNIHTWNEIRGTTTRVMGKKAVPVYIKPRVIKKIAGFIENVASFFGSYPVINREKANEMILEWTCSIEHARKELNYEPRVSLAEGLSRTIRWYKKHHWL